MKKAKDAEPSKESSAEAVTTSVAADKDDSKPVNGDGTAQAADKTSSAQPAQSNDSSQTPEKKHHLTWERSIEILKVAVTLWAALLGSFVTMQYNARQNELNRIQAIAQMLPHIGSSTQDTSKSGQGKDVLNPGDEMAREGAFWAIFRTANDRVMLRDLASLFPLDIYRVVSSIARAGELNHDPDAVVALEVASEKLAADYSMDPKHAELASRLYDQALRLRLRTADDDTPLRVVELSEQSASTEPTGDQLANLVKSINDLADARFTEAGSKTENKTIPSHFEAKQLYKRARKLGKDSNDQQVQEQVARADIALAHMCAKEKLADDSFFYLKEEIALETKITGKNDETRLIRAIDEDGDGHADSQELERGVEQAKQRLATIFKNFPDKGVALN